MKFSHSFSNNPYYSFLDTTELVFWDNSLLHHQSIFPGREKCSFCHHRMLLKMAMTIMSGDGSFSLPLSSILNYFFPMQFQERSSGCPQADPSLQSPLAVSDCFSRLSKEPILFYMTTSIMFIRRPLTKNLITVHQN